MNQFAISHLLTIFYISSVAANFSFDQLCSLKEARIEYLNGENAPRTFKEGNAYLYRATDQLLGTISYAVGDGSGNFSQRFFFDKSCTLVVGNKLTITEPPVRMITIIVDNAFDLYQRFISFGNYDEHFSVARIHQGRNTFEVTALKGDIFDRHQSIFVALDKKNVPRVLFPSLNSILSRNRNSVKDVSVRLETNPQSVVTITFADSANADRFYDHLDALLRNYKKYVLGIN